MRGVVQGVGFRYYVTRWATESGITGWVRNLSDGSVEIVAEGDGAVVDAFVELVRAGPPGARVTMLEREAIEETGRYRGFDIVRNSEC